MHCKVYYVFFSSFYVYVIQITIDLCFFYPGGGATTISTVCAPLYDNNTHIYI